MKNLFVMGNPDSGKTAVILGLAQKFKELGNRVGYFKPIDNGRKTATGKVPGGDAVLMKHVLGIEASLGEISPVKAGPSYLTRIEENAYSMQDVKSAYTEIARDCDIVLIEGAVHPYALSSVGLDSVTLAGELNAHAITVQRVDDDYSLDLAIFYNRYISGQGINLLGTIFSNVPRQLLAKTEGVFRPAIEKSGFKALGVIPSRPEIASPTVNEFRERLGGEVLVGQENMDRLVEDVVVGAMTMDSALTYLRRSANKAVVMGGDRSDLALAALETHTSALILTGGLYPDVGVLARAGEKGVPVILTYQDTYTVIEMIGQVSRNLKPTDKEGIAVTLDNINQYCDWQYILDAI
ncbi:phosphotransacetylase family protein [Desulfoscipio gibsoniae]|uniref:Protein with phosphotransacetylase BioD-like N-terminal domain n=1 Tax=Desulfoscipio gibsoniae DSM 7213 TaxID=767817 RepID=R4KMB5_9FIRM|nr:phosphotransacetylase family protein [Desulfoscipio gibsoniae]AGL02697.1 protein with phosphotransacetylase BioD-like N-terminal domain [Desulfoscipio gibsoniae DSM 7213]